MIEIDGSNGGGQILRTALSLSMVKNIPFRMINIRSKRPKPGLRPQHKSCIDILLNISKSRAFGNELGSTELEFIPGLITKRNFEWDIGTAGSIPLLLQSILPATIALGKQFSLTITGGTDVKFAPCIDYLKNVFIRTLNIDTDLNVIRRGYYPKGDGQVKLTVRPNGLAFKPFDLSIFGKLVSIQGISHSSLSLQTVAERQKSMAELLCREICQFVNISCQSSETKSPGSVICIWALLTHDDENVWALGVDELGEKGVSSERVAEKASNRLKELIKSKVPIDPHLADMLIPYMALAPGSKIKTTNMTKHIETNIDTCKKFIDIEFNVNDNMISTIESLQ
ncbi:RNA 3'-terminal phosphate cyclase [Candidatus Woesearchaeota archaeon]|nr:RNA 3'-terminal phosphate cyclase [Candidatus Woesearchaeota archaeon]